MNFRPSDFLDFMFWVEGREMGLLPMVWYGSSIFYIIYGDSAVLADLGAGVSFTLADGVVDTS